MKARFRVCGAAWRAAVEAEYAEPAANVVEGYAKDGVSLADAAAILETTAGALAKFAGAVKVVFGCNNRGQRLANGSRAESVSKARRASGAGLLVDVSKITKVSYLAVRQRKRRGWPVHQLGAQIRGAEA
jgi:hypothetical protein